MHSFLVPFAVQWIIFMSALISLTYSLRPFLSPTERLSSSSCQYALNCSSSLASVGAGISLIMLITSLRLQSFQRKNPQDRLYSWQQQ